MPILKRLYFDLFVLVYALYAFFNKGIAYTYLSEMVLALGLLLIVANIRKLEFGWDKRMALLLFFVFITAIYILRGIGAYGIKDVIRDSVIFNYILFVFVVYFLKDELAHLKQRLVQVYRWYPLLMCAFFLISSYVPFFRDLELFGGQRLFLYKFGDMGVHLFIATIFLLNGYIQLSKRMLVIQLLLIAYLFLITSSYSRSGMLSYALGMLVFFFYSKNLALRKQMVQALKFVPLFFILALPLYLSTNLEENFQGRSLSLNQLKQNATSIFVSADDGTSLSDNKVWRLVWWASIINDTFLGPDFWAGKGLGMSLAETAGMKYDPTEGDLRSPHNFHLTILGRFGVPLFFLWLYWMFLHLNSIRKKELDPFLLTVYVVTLVFLVNASFDVFLEGPMGAFPFWTFVGIGYATEAFHNKNEPVPTHES